MKFDAKMLFRSWLVLILGLSIMGPSVARPYFDLSLEANRGMVFDQRLQIVSWSTPSSFSTGSGATLTPMGFYVQLTPEQATEHASGKKAMLDAFDLQMTKKASIVYWRHIWVYYATWGGITSSTFLVGLFFSLYRRRRGRLLA